MVRVIVFNILYISISLYALIRGGAPERIGAAILIANFQLSHWLIEPLDSRYSGVEGTMLAVDAAAFLALYGLSLLSARFWPMWMAALQGCVVMSHLVGLSGEVIPWAYGNFVALWAYALLAVLALATRRHRQRLRRYGVDPAWPWQLPQAYRSGGAADEALAGEPVPVETRPPVALAAPGPERAGR